MYILFTGAPGSKWSSVVKNIYWSKDIDQTDYSDDRTYFHDADTPGNKQLMHIGAYWDPGMEFEPDNWDGPFKGVGQRIVKAHTFAHQLDELKDRGYPIVMVYRNDAECLDWWKHCGEFRITYPNYAPYYKNLDHMWTEIQRQNHDIMQFVKTEWNHIETPTNNYELCNLLKINSDHIVKTHNYKEKDIRVYVYQ